KGLPLAYDKDLQEDKAPLLDAQRAVTSALEACAGMIATARFRPERMRAALEAGELTATDGAEWLVKQASPCPGAQEPLGRMARTVPQQARRLADLSSRELQAFHPAFAGARRLFDPLRSLAARDLPGGPAPKRVRAEVRRWRRALS